MAEEMSYIQELVLEKDNLDQSFVHAQRLLGQEISRIREPIKEETLDSNSHMTEFNGKPGSPLHASEPPNASQPQDGPQMKGQNARTFRRPGEYVAEEVVKLSEKVFVPVKEFPKFNFVGKLLGPRGNTLKRLQAQTGTKMSVLGKGSMRDKEKEDELRENGDPKYGHLVEPLHVLIEVEGVQSDAHLRLAGALSEIKKYMTPENDDIRVQQMQEMAYLQSLDNPESVPALPPQMAQMTQIPMTLQPVARGRPRQIFRGAPGGLVRGARGGRGGKPVIVSQGFGRPVRWVGGVTRMPMPSRGMGRALIAHRTVIAQRHPAPAQNHRVEQVAVAASPEQYDTYDATYDAAYDAGYSESGAENVYYDYSGAEAYEYAPSSSANFQSTTAYKAQSVRPLKRSIREAAYPY